MYVYCNWDEISMNSFVFFNVLNTFKKSSAGISAVLKLNSTMGRLLRRLQWFVLKFFESLCYKITKQNDILRLGKMDTSSSIFLDEVNEHLQYQFLDSVRITSIESNLFNQLIIPIKQHLLNINKIKTDK